MTTRTHLANRSASAADQDTCDPEDNQWRQEEGHDHDDSSPLMEPGQGHSSFFGSSCGIDCNRSLPRCYTPPECAKQACFIICDN
ncbi:MAG: hypothetical protein HQL63_02665 [Magnetococcales bacterium]|nr:hypothetical protein [Magnetococcales bacterium]MBF0322793.1 hypothetical protein [Magnetococcales bacterium]